MLSIGAMASVETMTLVMPAYNGGSDGPRELPEDGKALQALQESQLPQEFANYIYPRAQRLLGCTARHFRHCLSWCA